MSAVLLPHGSLFADELANAYSAVTGLETDGLDIIRSAERVYQVERAINTLRGMTRKNDGFTRRPEPDSWGQGIDLNARGMLDEYYDYRGLSPDGLPCRQRLEEVELKPVAETLELLNLLGKSNTCLPVSTIAKNPAGKEIGRNIISKIINRIEKWRMKKMEEPGYYRRAFEKQSRKIQKKYFRKSTGAGGYPRSRPTKLV